MRVLKLVGFYFLWHYGRAFADIAERYINILWFLLNFFSIPDLLRTFVSPFQRIQERYAGGFDVEEFLSITIVNLLMRIVGMVVRSFVIVAGILVLLAAFILGAFYFVVWLVLPFLVAALMVVGIQLIVTSL